MGVGVAGKKERVGQVRVSGVDGGGQTGSHIVYAYSLDSIRPSEWPFYSESPI